MDIVIPDDFPPTYASLDQPDLARLRPYGAVKLHTTRAADRSELFTRIEPAEVLINVRAYTALDDEAFSHAPPLRTGPVPRWRSTTAFAVPAGSPTAGAGRPTAVGPGRCSS